MLQNCGTYCPILKENELKTWLHILQGIDGSGNKLNYNITSGLSHVNNKTNSDCLLRYILIRSMNYYIIISFSVIN